LTRSAPRIPQRLLDAIDRIDDRREPLAEIARRVAAEADRLGLTRPSYERLRQLIHESRAIRARRGPGPVEMILEFGAEPTRGTFERISKSLAERGL
jgi:hypothetical protein